MSYWRSKTSPMRIKDSWSSRATRAGKWLSWVDSPPNSGRTFVNTKTLLNGHRYAFQPNPQEIEQTPKISWIKVVWQPPFSARLNEQTQIYSHWIENQPLQRRLLKKLPGYPVIPFPNAFWGIRSPSVASAWPTMVPKADWKQKSSNGQNRFNFLSPSIQRTSKCPL